MKPIPIHLRRAYRDHRISDAEIHDLFDKNYGYGWEGSARVPDKCTVERFASAVIDLYESRKGLDRRSEYSSDRRRNGDRRH